MRSGDLEMTSSMARMLQSPCPEPRTCSGASPHSRNALKCVPSMWRAFSEVTGGRILWVTVACVEVEGEVGTLQWLPTRLHLISDPGRSAAHWWHISQRSLCVWVACWKTEEERMPVCVMNYFLAESGEPSDLSFFNGGSLICLWLRETSPPDSFLWLCSGWWLFPFFEGGRGQGLFWWSHSFYKLRENIQRLWLITEFLLLWLTLSNILKERQNVLMRFF